MIQFIVTRITDAASVASQSQHSCHFLNPFSFCCYACVPCFSSFHFLIIKFATISILRCCLVGWSVTCGTLDLCMLDRYHLTPLFVSYSLPSHNPNPNPLPLSFRPCVALALKLNKPHCHLSVTSAFPLNLK